MIRTVSLNHPTLVAHYFVGGSLALRLSMTRFNFISNPGIQLKGSSNDVDGVYGH